MPTRNVNLTDALDRVVTKKVKTGDGPAGAGARMNALLYVDSDIVVPLEFLWGHEFDAHRFGAIWNGFHKLKVA